MNVRLKELEKRVRAKDLKSPGGLLNDMFTKKINEYFIRIITSFQNAGNSK
ncbi:hypothetical protein [Rossellomorea marisflavi]|nr:hypothetical protein [Rossellomorea marisflavi]